MISGLLMRQNCLRGLNKRKGIKMAKEYTVIVHNWNRGRVSEFTGTLEELVNHVFGYTLEVGESWQYEKGNKKINLHPKTIRSLITNLNNAVNNAAANGCASEYYELKQ